MFNDLKYFSRIFEWNFDTAGSSYNILGKPPPGFVFSLDRAGAKKYIIPWKRSLPGISFAFCGMIYLDKYGNQRFSF